MSRFIITLLLLAAFAFPSVQAQTDTFPLPQVPSALNTPGARANYLALHYWDKYDFADNSLIGSKNISEQGFSNFISIMPYVTQREEAFEVLVSRMATNRRMVSYFMALAEKYLSEPLSPVYDEALYLLMLEKVVGCDAVSARDREEYGFDLRMAQKNRIGTKATDFAYLSRDGRRGRLQGVKGYDYVLLFLGDPECDICVRTKEELASSAVIKKMVDEGKLAVLSVCVEGKTEMWEATVAPKGWIDACDDKMAIYDKQLYEVKGLPVLYLLDGNHNILMKNVQPEQVIRRLSGGQR